MADGLEIKERVQELIATTINPVVAGHGHVTLVDVDDTRVYLEVGGDRERGAAAGTLRSGIERLIKDEVPEVTEVIDVTGHAERPGRSGA